MSITSQIRSASRKFVLAVSLLTIAFPAGAFAEPLPFFDTIPDGRAEFDLRVNNANGTLYTHALSGLANNTDTWALGDFTITSTNGNPRNTSNGVLNNFSGALSGVPGGDAVGMNADGSTGSGLTFTFANAINGFGLDLQGWATCCYPSGLYISFDGGTPILVGSAATGTDNPGAAAGHGPTTFVGAIDDAGTFNVITFYGLASGDAMNAGGIIRYALVPLGSISGGSGYVNSTQNTPVQSYASYFKENEGTGPRQTVSNYLDTLTKEQATEALKTLFPVNTSVTSQTMLSSSGQTSSVLMEKVGTVLGNTMATPNMGFANGASNFDPSAWLFGDNRTSGAGVAGGDLAMSLASSPYKKFNMGQQAVWFQGVGAYADGDATASTLGYETVTGGFVGGFERAIDENNLMGVIASNFWSDVELDSDAGETKARNYNLGVYGQKIIGESKLTAVVSGGYGDYESERRINLGGIIAAPEADYNGWSASTSLSASHLFTHGGLKLEPFAQVSYTHVWTDGYTEKNGGAFNMSVSKDQFSTAGAKIGVNLEHDFAVSERKLTVSAKPYVGKQWEIESASNTTRIAGAVNETTVNGRDMNVYDFGITTQITYDLSDTTNLKFGADVSRDKYEDRAVGFVGVGIKF